MTSHPIDVHVGKRLRYRRTMIGMSQEDLGKAVGITFQQIQKYERGLNRIGSSRLYEFSVILNVPVAFFFEGLEASSSTDNNDAGKIEVREEEGTYEHEKLNNKEILTLVRYYSSIEDENVRKKIMALIKSLVPDNEE